MYTKIKQLNAYRCNTQHYFKIIQNKLQNKQEYPHNPKAAVSNSTSMSTQQDKYQQ